MSEKIIIKALEKMASDLMTDRDKYKQHLKRTEKVLSLLEGRLRNVDKAAWILIDEALIRIKELGDE